MNGLLKILIENYDIFLVVLLVELYIILIIPSLLYFFFYLYYSIRFKLAVKKWRIFIPPAIKIYNEPWCPKSPCGNFIYLGVYYPKNKIIVIYRSKKNVFAYLSTLFHELSHWTELRLGRKSYSSADYYKAIEESDIITLKKYYINEITAEMTSKLLSKHYNLIIPRDFYKNVRSIYMPKSTGIPLSIGNYRYIINSAKVSCKYIINNSNRRL